MSKQHGFTNRVIFKRGTRANLLSTIVSNEGHIGQGHYTTDTKQLFIHDGTRVQPVLSLDMVLTHRDTGSILVNRDNGAILTRY